MIPHRKHPLFNRLFVAYARSRLRGAFHAVRVEGLEGAREVVHAGPVVVVSNHTCWWDALVLMWLSNYALGEPSDGYALMDARNLRRLPFFRRLGVFGVDLDDADDRAAVLEYAAGLLDAPGRQVWIFPQGAERPVTEPLEFRRGAAVIAHAVGVPTLPMALRFEHGKHDRPTLYIAFGEPLAPGDGGQEDVARQEAAVAALLARIEVEVRAASRGQGEMPVALTGRRNALGAAAERALAVLTGRGSRRSSSPRPSR